MDLVPIYRNHIMFAHDLYRSQVNFLASGSEILRLGEEYYRLILKRQSEASPPACKPMRPTGWPPARSGTILRLGEKRARSLPSGLEALRAGSGLGERDGFV